MFRVDAPFCIILAQSSQGPLRALAVFIRALILYEILRMLVHAKVCQVHVSSLDVSGLAGVLVGREPHKPILEQINPQGVVAGDEHIDPEIVLQVIDEVRIGDVLRN